MAGVDDLAVLVLAAGGGSRMRSRLPKVLHAVCGRPIVRYQLGLARDLGAVRIIVVVGTDEAELRQALRDDDVEIVRQQEPLGTAHAVLAAKGLLADHRGPILINYGDHALYRPSTFASLIDVYRSREADLALLTAQLPDPSGYGRVVRDADGRLERVVEERDASPEIREIREGSMGVYVTNARFLFEALQQVGNDNERGEYYLTDLVKLALDKGRSVTTDTVTDWQESLGINDRRDLALAERVMRQRIADAWMSEGVTFVDPDRTYVDAGVYIGTDTVLEPGAVLRGRTRIGARCRIASGAVIDDSIVGDECFVKPHCWLEGALLGQRCIIGPSAHLRPQTELADEVRIGNFVEVKNSSLGRGTKADHLAYIGDADVGSGVTIGCGAITVNYDGESKHRTIIGDDAFVGCNANLIAPVRIEPDGYVAAGSTITRDVPEGALGVGRARQRNVEGWRARRMGKRDHD